MAKYLLLNILTLLFGTTLYAQKVDSQSYFLNFGVAIPSTKETHFTSNFRRGVGYNVQMGYERKSLKSTNRFSVLFLQANQGKGNISYSTILRPEIKYEHLRSINENGLWIGGYYDIGTLLNFRRGIWGSEKGINYTIWSSVGVSSQYNKQIRLMDKQFRWNTRFSIPILTYLIRPSYTFPYPDNYLQSGVFSFDRNGLGKKIVSGGNFVTFDKFLNVSFQTGISIPTENKKWEFGINYSFNYMQTNELKPVFQPIHSLNFNIKFLK